MKYRIITNGEKYRVQYRRWWHGWITVRDYILEIPISFKSIQDAKAGIESLKDEKLREKWKPVKE